MHAPRIKKVALADAEFSLEVTWENGSSSIVSLADPIQRLKVFKNLRTGDLFRKVKVADYGFALRWTDEIDMSADTVWRLAQEQAGKAMSAKDFREWRARHKFTLDKAAEELGISRRMLAYYDSGERPIPKSIWLACRYFDLEARSVLAQTLVSEGVLSLGEALRLGEPVTPVERYVIGRSRFEEVFANVKRLSHMLSENPHVPPKAPPDPQTRRKRYRVDEP